MKLKLFLLISLVPLITFGQSYQKYKLQRDGLSIWLSEGVLNTVPLSYGFGNKQTDRIKSREHTVQVVYKASNKLSWKLADNQTTFRSPDAKSLVLLAQRRKCRWGLYRPQQNIKYIFLQSSGYEEEKTILNF